MTSATRVIDGETYVHERSERGAAQRLIGTKASAVYSSLGWGGTITSSRPSRGWAAKLPGSTDVLRDKRGRVRTFGDGEAAIRAAIRAQAA